MLWSRKSPVNKPRSIRDNIIYGIHPVLETIKARRRDVHEILPSRASGRFLESLHQTGIPVRPVSPAELLSITGSPHHQGVAAKVGPFPYADITDLVASAGFILLLDEVQDPANVGNIIRVCETLGAGGLIITKDRAAPISPVVEKASAGASAHVPIARVVNLSRAIQTLKREGYWVYAAQAGADTLYWEVDYDAKTALVLGSEGTGIRKLVRENCDRALSILMQGKIESLNVAQTASVVLSEALRQRMCKKKLH
jgi:23S rRNA (guanosine2251-2'-O)-methyltransferase